MKAIYSTVEDDDDAFRQGRPIVAEIGRLVERMGRVRAVTAEGIQARALALHHSNPCQGFSFDDPETETGRLLVYLLRDAAALGGANS